jgi:outer membrane protein OmpA-like peptidoglycan-associated protein
LGIAKSQEDVMRYSHALTIAAATFALAALAAPAQAADPCAGGLAAARIVDCLRPDGLSGPSRGFRSPGGAPVAAPGKAAPAGAAGAHPAAMAQRPTVNLLVPFDFGSAQLTAAGRKALDALGQALQQPALAEARFELGGHTDAVGTAEYNLALSQRRADAARDYLVNHEHIDASRLTTVGYGSTRLYDAAAPDAAVNRRVQVTRLGS